MRIGMRIGPSVALAVASWAAVAIAPGRAQALFHESVISEVLASLDGDADLQFVEIEMQIDAQNFVDNTVLAAFDADGVYVEDVFVVDDDLANGGAGSRWTMATEAFQDATGFEADFTIPAGIPLGGGMICWGAPGVVAPPDPSTWDHTDPENYADCLAYGTYDGPTNPLIGDPTPLVPEGHALARIGETHDNAADFACVDLARPTNNDGESVAVEASSPCGASRGSGIQITPDDERVLVSKDVGAERWSITRNLDDSTVTGNVFFPEGGDPLFLFCEQEDEVDGELALACFGADRCTDTECPPFEFISDVVLPESFFEPPVDLAAVASRVREAVVASRGSRAAAGAGTETPAGGVARGSGIQITPDEERVLVNKDVGDERWAITRNLDDLTVTGNVFFPEGGDPVFLFCEQTAQIGTDLEFSCSAADACTDEGCPPFEFVSEATLPESFFQPPSGPSPTGSPTPEPTPSGEPTPEPTPSGEPTPEPTPSGEPTPEPTSSGEPTPGPTPTDEPTPGPTPTDGPTPEPTPTDEVTPSPSPTAP